MHMTHSKMGTPPLQSIAVLGTSAGILAIFAPRSCPAHGSVLGAPPVRKPKIPSFERIINYPRIIVATITSTRSTRIDLYAYRSHLEHAQHSIITCWSARTYIYIPPVARNMKPM